MLVKERYEHILQLLDEHGGARVTELSKRFGVTEETIRRDLDQLEKEKRLIRSHGGAMPLREQHQTETFHFEREIKNIDEKKSIAKAAVQQINENDRIILDPSSTAWYMSKQLPNIPLTVVTNSLKVAMELSGKSHIQVVSTGGILSPRSLSYIGPLAESSLDIYHVDKAFLSCQGVHMERGISDSNELQAHVKQKMIDVADQVYVMVDYSKFWVQSFAHITDWQEIDMVITDSKTGATYIQQLEDKQVRIHCL